MNEFVPYITWDESEKSEIHSLEELDKLLDSLHKHASKTANIFSVEFFNSENTGLLITIGANESHVEYYTKNGRPPIVSCKEDNDNPELHLFLHHGEPSSVNKTSCVSIKDARNAIREYYQKRIAQRTSIGCNNG